MNRFFLIIIVFLVFINGSCQSLSNKSENVQKEAVLRKILLSPVQTLDPIDTLEVYSAQIITNLYDTLFELDENLEPKSHLIESYTYNSKNKKYNFVLKKGIYFTNGTELTSDDVVFTFFRFCKKKREDLKIDNIIEGCKAIKAGSHASNFGVKKESPHQFSIALTSHYPPFILNIASHHFSIIPHDFAGLSENDYWKKPISTGAYLLERINDKEVILAVNKNYFLGKPPIDRVIYSVTNTTDAQKNISQDLWDDTWPISLKEPPNQNYVPYRVNVATAVVLGFNLKKPPMDSPWFRKAIDVLIDKRQILKSLGEEGVIEASGFVPYGALGYLDQLKNHSPDNQLAKKYFSLAGFRSIESIPKLTLHTSNKNKWIDEIVSQLTSAGLRIELQRVSFPDLMSSLQENNINLFIIGIQLNQPETYHLLEYFKSDYPLTAFNAHSPQFDQLLEGSQNISDRLQRGKIYQEANKLIFENTWVSNLYHRSYGTGYIKKKFKMPVINYLGPEFMHLRDVQVMP